MTEVEENEVFCVCRIRIIDAKTAGNDVKCGNCTKRIILDKRIIEIIKNKPEYAAINERNQIDELPEEPLYATAESLQTGADED